MPTARPPVLAVLTLLLTLAAHAHTAAAQDWPAFRGDLRRSGIAPQGFEVPTLSLDWRYQPELPPAPAWPGPARWDAYAGLKGLKSMRNYDPAFHAVVAGERVLFASSADDTVRCLDVRTGAQLWRFTAGGPVRVAPLVHEEAVYFGSDDGSAYRLDLATGSLAWRTNPTEQRLGTDKPLILNNGRLISRWPVRSGVVVHDGTAYFAAAMLPWEPAYLCAVDAATGRPDGPGRYVRDLGLERTFEGPLLYASGTLVAPQGRIPPMLINADTGEPAGPLGGGGGSFVLLTSDDRVLHGPGNKAGWITDSDAQSRARIASYDRGNAIIVDGDTTYLLSDQALAAMDRSSKRIHWLTETDHPLEIILVGDVLYAGGDGEVAAYHAHDGRLLWRHRVEGRAFGLAAGAGRLLVSTDSGAIYCFNPDPSLPLAAAPDDADDTPAQVDLAPIEPVDVPGLIDRWVMDPRLIESRRGPDAQVAGPPAVRNLAAGPDAVVMGLPKTETVRGERHATAALRLDGTSGDMQAAEDFRTASPPQSQLTAEAWVRIDDGAQWGGILGMSQDNGSYEKGWLLGYRGEQLAFSVAGVDGAPGLTWIRDPNPTEMGAWRHVAGVYDGREMRLFVDGRLVASSTAQSGPIDYPEWAYYHIAAYRDQDEHFRLNGMVAEVRRYNRALTADEVAANARAREGDFPSAPVREVSPTPVPLAAGPMMRFPQGGQVEVLWETVEPSPTVAALAGQGINAHTHDPRPTRHHRATFTGLTPGRVYQLTLSAADGGELAFAGSFDVDTHFDYAPRAGVPAATELWILADLVDGAKAIELARDGRARVVALTDDAGLAERVRDHAIDEGLYGYWLTVIEVQDATRPPLPPRCANRVLSERAETGAAPAASARELVRLVQPGGTLDLPAQAADRMPDADALPPAHRVGDRLLVVGPAIEGAAPWTHMYGLPDNAAFAGEHLGGARDIAAMDVQWIGRPGPRYQSDRQNRKPAPLAAGGTLYVQGLYRVIAMDAYNGMIRWVRELPRMARFNVPRDSANWAADDESVTIAIADRALRFDAHTGELIRTYPLHAAGEGMAWGFIARHEDLLIGSAVREDAPYTDWWGGQNWYDGIADPTARKVASDGLFAVGARAGAPRWSYSGGLILNPTITIAPDARGRQLLTFVEVRDAGLMASDNRRLGGQDVWANQHLVALDPYNGSVVWERPIDTRDGVTAFYAAAAEGWLVLTASSEGQFGVHTVDLASGEDGWARDYPWETNHHGKHLSRPAIVGGRIFLRPHVLELDTGEPTELRFPSGHQCGTYACSTAGVILRAGNLTIWDSVENDASRFNRVRPDCWLSTIPALGMLLSPEGGGGCSCGSWMEMSFAMMPRAADPRQATPKQDEPASITAR